MALRVTEINAIGETVLQKILQVEEDFKEKYINEIDISEIEPIDQLDYINLKLFSEKINKQYIIEYEEYLSFIENKYKDPNYVWRNIFAKTNGNIFLNNIDENLKILKDLKIKNYVKDKYNFKETERQKALNNISLIIRDIEMGLEKGEKKKSDSYIQEAYTIYRNKYMPYLDTYLDN